MIPFRTAISAMISAPAAEIDALCALCSTRDLKKGERIDATTGVVQEVYFLTTGLLRVLIADRKGNEHTVHFAFEHQFIADYAGFLQQLPGSYSLEALEPTELIVLPRKALEWGYANMAQGDRLGRVIAEAYFIYHDDRIKNQYLRSPRERYDSLKQCFPNIHNRVSQHMIASYLGISPVHLSRLKKGAKQ